MQEFIVKIKLRRKPETCDSCPFDYDTISCTATMDITEEHDEEYRDRCRHHECNTQREIEKWCPLEPSHEKQSL